MPANRRPQDREEKRSEIIAAALTLFVEVGFDRTPMTHVAQQAGVTTTTIYWYFQDKDALLVAVLDEALSRAALEYASRGDQPWEDQVLWAIDNLQLLHRLVAVVHARASASPLIADWHDRFHALADLVLADELRRAGVSEDNLVAATRIGVFVIEGLLTHPHDAESTGDIVRLLGVLT